jgi:cysteine desulfurase family protein (TIGR01976 family)
VTLTRTQFDVAAARAHFPALARMIDGRPVVYLDGPGGTQVPRECIRSMQAYLETSNANLHGLFPASRETDAVVADAHLAAAEFLGSNDPGEVVFGPNMTTLTFALSRSLARTIRPGDEIVVTRLDHDANVAPWLTLGEERGARIRWVGVQQEDCTLDLEGLARQVGPRTRLVAVGLASNAVGTVNPIRRIADMSHAVGALLFVDAVHAAPHMPIDVRALGADLLACSTYKFFGPHLGLLWGRRAVLEDLPAIKVRPATDELPGRFETGTANHEGLAGLLGTYRYLEWLGASHGAARGEPGAADGGRHERLRAAMLAIQAYERSLTRRLVGALQSVPGLEIRGIVDPARIDERVPTVAFTLRGHRPADVSAYLGELGISTWHGDYYAYELIRALGLAEAGGMVRVGLVHYNTLDEIDRLMEALGELTAA